MADDTESDEDAIALAGAERLKAFVDAVVAIALTLLILPLMESVGEAASENVTAFEWATNESAQLFSFVLSFVIIANIWLGHHRLFTRVELVSPRLIWLTLAWLLMIVWLPVATAIIGQLDRDPLQMIMYIGAMAVASLLTLCTRLYLRAHPRLHEISDTRLRRGMVLDVTMSSLLLIALGLSLAIPALSYWPMMLLLLTGPLARLFARRFARPATAGS